MNLLFWGLTLGVIGKVLVVLAVLHMHHSIVREHRIDKAVIFTYRQERIITFLGLILIVAGYIMEVYFYEFISIPSCLGKDCAGLLIGTPLSE